MERFLWICLAGAAGTGVRYAVGLWAGERLGTTFPYGTLIVNVVGCFLIAVVLQAALQLAAFPPTLRLALTTGFMGGLTTYSSFNYETTKLFADGARLVAVVNVLATLLGCAIAGLLGVAIARRLFAA